MSEKERSALVARLMAAASVLGLSLGMATGSADADQLKGEHKAGATSTQIKGQSDQHKLTTNDHKLDTNVHKGETGFLKHNTGDSTQIKHPGTSVQDKHDIPSSQLNAQPEPPFPPNPTTSGTPQKH